MIDNNKHIPTYYTYSLFVKDYMISEVIEHLLQNFNQSFIFIVIHNLEKCIQLLLETLLNTDTLWFQNNFEYKWNIENKEIVFNCETNVKIGWC